MSKLAVGNLLQGRFLGPQTQLPLLNKLARQGGILSERQILIRVLPSKHIRGIGAKYHLEPNLRVGGGGIQSPLRFGKNRLIQ